MIFKFTIQLVFLSFALTFIRPCFAQMPFTQIHFATNSDKILSHEIPKLALIIEWLRENVDEVFVLEGHCDERGGPDFNVELGDRRARSVKGWLIANGIDLSRIIMLVSYGEDLPLDPSHNENAWRLNRRVEFVVR